MVPGILPPALGVPTPSLSANMPFALTPPPDSTSSLPIFQSLFSHACPTKAPGEKNRMHSSYQAFTTTPLTGGEKDRREKARKESEQTPSQARCPSAGIDSDVSLSAAVGQKAAGTDPTPYLLPHELMVEQAYPECLQQQSDPLDSPTFDDWKREDGWVEAPYVSPNDGPPVVLGIDCEMVSRALQPPCHPTWEAEPSPTPRSA